MGVGSSNKTRTCGDYNKCAGGEGSGESSMMRDGENTAGEGSGDGASVQRDDEADVASRAELQCGCVNCDMIVNKNCVSNEHQFCFDHVRVTRSMTRKAEAGSSGMMLAQSDDARMAAIELETPSLAQGECASEATASAGANDSKTAPACAKRRASMHSNGTATVCAKSSETSVVSRDPRKSAQIRANPHASNYY
jgi:hypothetical protein